MKLNFTFQIQQIKLILYHQWATRTDCEYKNTQHVRYFYKMLIFYKAFPWYCSNSFTSPAVKLAKMENKMTCINLQWRPLSFTKLCKVLFLTVIQLRINRKSAQASLLETLWFFNLCWPQITTKKYVNLFSSVADLHAKYKLSPILFFWRSLHTNLVSAIPNDLWHPIITITIMHSLWPNNMSNMLLS